MSVTTLRRKKIDLSKISSNTQKPLQPHFNCTQMKHNPMTFNLKKKQTTNRKTKKRTSLENIIIHYQQS